jgi:hypothetical protein
VTTHPNALAATLKLFADIQEAPENTDTGWGAWATE